MSTPRRPLIAGNWKMNGLRADGRILASGLSDLMKDETDAVFDLLADRAWSVHLKDVHWDPGFMFIKMDEVLVGDGVMDYDTLLKRLAKLPEDQPCYCEHLKSEEAYIENFKRVHERAEKAGVRFKRRGE